MFAEKSFGLRGIFARGFNFVLAFSWAAVLGRKKAWYATAQLMVGLILAISAQSSFAITTYSWTNGSGDGTWENTGNWNPTGPSPWNSTANYSAFFNTSAATATLNVSNSAQSIYFGSGSAGDEIIANSGGSLALGSGVAINGSALTSGTVNITAPITATVGAATWYGPTSSGTLVLNSTITTNQNFTWESGNLQIAGGTLQTTATGNFMLFNNAPGVSNVLQTGGYVFCDRTSANAIYLSQGIGFGGCNYSISGGSLGIVLGSNSVLVVSYGNNSGPSTFNISGNAVVKVPKIYLNGNTSTNGTGIGSVNMQGGLLQVNEMFDTYLLNGAFNFSGGTIEPINLSGATSNGATGDFIGNPLATDNFNMPITGTSAAFYTTDTSGTAGQSVALYANTSGTGSLTVYGLGTLVFAGTNTGNYSGQINVNSGTVKVATNNSISPAFTTGNVNVNGGTLDLAGNSPTVGTVTLASGLITDSVGGGSITTTGFPSFALQSGTVSAVLTGPSATLTKTTTGRVNLASANTYGGLSTISAGTLALIYPNGNLGTGNVTITSGAVLDTSSYDANSSVATLFGLSGGTLSAGRTGTPGIDVNGSVALQGATLNLPTGGTLTIAGNLTFKSGNETYLYAPGDLINTTTGGLTFNTTTSILPTGSLASGTYTLFAYGGADPNISDLGMASSFQAGTRQTYLFSAGSGAVTLSVSGAAPANLVWSVAGSSNWDVATTKSWYNLGTSASDYFYNADSVTFNDRPGGSSATVIVNGTVLPGSITVSNTNVAYTFSNSNFGQINGSASLIKSGPGTLTINTANGYSGGTTLSAGLLNLGNAAALGTGALNINGGTLDNTSGGPMTLNSIPQNWNAGFTFRGTQPLNLGPGAVTLGAPTTVNVSGGTLTVGGQIAGSYGLGLSGTGTLNLASANVYTGDTTVYSGVLQAGTTNPLPNGFGYGNLVFSGSVQSAALDLNGNNVAVNGLSQPIITSQTMIVNNQAFSQAVLSVGNNSNVTTFGGVLADNNNSAGGTLALTVAGGMLTLANTNTYSGATAVNGGTLALGTGAAGQDGQLLNTSGIANSSTLMVNNVGPTTLPSINAATTQTHGVLVQNGGSTLTLTGENYLASLVVNTTGISGGTINLAGGSSFNNASSTLWTLASQVNYPTGGSIIWNTGSGSMDIEAPIVDGVGQFNIDSAQHATGTVLLGNSGSISISGNALVLSDLAFATTNLVQTGGLISLDRPGSLGLYFAQAGVAYYTMTGGTISASSNTSATIGWGAATQGYFTINGPTALASFSTLNLNTQGAQGAGGIGSLTLENGVLAVNNVLTAGGGFPGFNFSGGTLQPIDNNVNAWGSSTSANNITINLSGTGAVMSSIDVSGNPQTVPVYANLTGSGAMTYTGSGMIVLGGNQGNYSYSNYTGGSFVTGSGTVQLARSNALGSGPLKISSAIVDLAGFNSTVGALTGNSFALITNNGPSNATLTVSSAATSTYSGTISESQYYLTALTQSGPGTLVLNGTNNYTGGTTVSGGTLVLDGAASLAAGTSLVIGSPSPGAVFMTPFASQQSSASSATLAPVPEPGTFVMLAVAALAGILIRRRATN